MPDSQFGHSPGTLTATLDELVALARALRAQPDRVPSSLTRLEGLCKMLDYFVAPQIGLRDGDGQRPIYLDTRCSWHSCARTWRDHDACLLNFAPRGEPPVWLCRDHHPPPGDGGIRPPGWQPDLATRDAAETQTARALAKLTGTERSRVNSRIVNMDAPSTGEA